MKKSLLLALALTSISLAGCADKTETTEIAPVVPVEPATPMAPDTTGMMGADPMMDTTGAMGAGSMEGSSMEAAPMTADTAATGTGM